MKPCGCPRTGLTRNVTLWYCRGCGEVQSANRRRCQNTDCQRVKPTHPRGYGCCAVDWHIQAASCGDLLHAASQVPQVWEPCGRMFEASDVAKLPHPEHEYFAPVCKRGAFTDRRGISRCVGCLAPEPVGVLDE